MKVALIHTIKMTAEQYFQLGEDPPGVRLELIEGKIIALPGNTPRHSRTVIQLSCILSLHIERANLGELILNTDIAFDAHTVRRPDICFYSKTNLHFVSETRLLSSPDLCIEILSPGNVEDDRINKFNLYSQHGVKHYWIIDPATRSAECYALNDSTYELVNTGSASQTVAFPPFNTLQIPLSDLWT